ncbi:MAG TPA: hypothetical protein VMM36_03965 [Opitutaceae bacterium]|nr:hypothetical protein [Opitutaceae bacterium]
MLYRLPRWFYAFMFAAGIALGAWRVYAWAPERYVPAKFDAFIERVEANRWSMAGWIVATEYSDRWGYDKESLVGSGRSLFRHFQWVELRRGAETWTFAPGSATVTVTLELRGEGTQLATMARDTALTATEPFTFTFRKTGAMPWSWKIVSIDQPQLRIDRGRASY